MGEVPVSGRVPSMRADRPYATRSPQVWIVEPVSHPASAHRSGRGSAARYRTAGGCSSRSFARIDLVPRRASGRAQHDRVPSPAFARPALLGSSRAGDRQRKRHAATLARDTTCQARVRCRRSHALRAALQGETGRQFSHARPRRAATDFRPPARTGAKAVQHEGSSRQWIPYKSAPASTFWCFDRKPSRVTVCHTDPVRRPRSSVRTP